jgi:uncharacterized protein (DUF1330 family)
MPANVVITKPRTRNQTELALYAKQAPIFMAGHAATFVARFGICETMGGAGVEGVAIIEFPAFAEAKTWYESPDYQEASQTARLSSTDWRRKRAPKNMLNAARRSRQRTARPEPNRRQRIAQCL